MSLQLDEGEEKMNYAQEEELQSQESVPMNLYICISVGSSTKITRKI